MHGLWPIYVILAYIGVLRALFVLGRWNARRKEPRESDDMVSMTAHEFVLIWGFVVPAAVILGAMILVVLHQSACAGHSGGWC